MSRIIEIGNNFCDAHRNYTIINKRKIIHNNKTETQYQYKCHLCGYDCSECYRKGKLIKEIWINSSQINKGNRCACCANKIVVPNINSIYATSKDMVSYFKDRVQSEIYCKNSNVDVRLICPYCSTEKTMLLTNFARRGFSCPKCSDKISIGEKMLYCVLDSLGVNFIKELSKSTHKWCKQYRYDFYIFESNTIIEVHGKQHYKGKGFSSFNNKSVHDEIENDKNKLALAKNNGIKNYIVIDASKSDFNYIKESILSSDLSKIYDLSKVNWKNIKKLTSKSLIKQVCTTWNDNPTITLDNMANKYHLNKNTIGTYLKIGNEIGWCEYEGTFKTQHYNNIYKDNAPDSSKPIKCINNNIYFKSIGLCSKNSKKIFGKHMGDSSIRFRLNNNNPKSRKNNFNFIYITKEQFNKAIKKNCTCFGEAFLL